MGPKGVGAVGDEEEKEEGERMEGGCGDRREKRHEGQYAAYASVKYSRTSTPLAQFRLFGMLDRKKLYAVSHYFILDFGIIRAEMSCVRRERKQKTSILR